MKPIEVTNEYYAKDPSIELHPAELRSMELHSNKKDPKFKVRDNVRISKYKSIFAIGYTPIYYIDKLVPIPVDLSKLSDVLKKDVVKKAVYNKLVAKVDNIDTSDFVLKTKYNTDKAELET